MCNWSTRIAQQGLTGLTVPASRTFQGLEVCPLDYSRYQLEADEQVTFSC